ncbi:O-succinylbenzoic acid--CoA ligase [Gracilibacillus halophilus YIM-C55.5]|uniref:2-succinylbenzoate--CoA ligase n=1 Tax=Gracilibacillus halophilus YIM-C55.5 TaxID=1308866 RepID=N4WLU7_9BACI|nr:o-succinylbenzoate--CoA ligase [Gracilibacillus halophilus]ENH97122.1 O-succinylbenzoic acid--CoA ligase [Gracilibacillus halophilus YIM-C55.5]
MSHIMEHWLEKRAHLSPHDTAIETVTGEVWTFRQLRDAACDLAKRVASIGPKETSHIGILSNNSVDMILHFFACTYLQCPAVFFNTRLSIAELKQQCDIADVEMLLTADQYHTIGKELADEKNLPHYTFREVKQCQPLSISVATDIDLDVVCSMMFTSGTTGIPKAVMHTFNNHWSSAISSALHLGLYSSDKWLACLPLFHIGGLSIVIKSVIYGMPIYLLETFDEKQVHDAIMYQQVTMISVVAVTCQRLLHVLGDQRYPDTFRCMLLGGGPAPKSLLEQAREKEVPIVQTYGMTETCSQIATLSASDALRKLGSAGKALFPASLQIWQDEKQQSTGQIGEIVVRGPMVTKGYYQRPDANQSVFQNGWLYTGDVGYVDDEGFLYVVDRRSDLIISGGENIYPAEVEDVLLQLSAINEAGVVGIKNQTWGEVPIAFVVLSETIDQETILSHCKKNLASFKVPKQIHFVDDLPRNATNKLQRHRLKEWGTKHQA